MTTLITEDAVDISSREPSRASSWIEVSSWMALIPALFITVGGRVQLVEAGPVALRVTAMAEDSFVRRVAMLICSLIILSLISTRFSDVLRVLITKRLLLVLPVLAFVSVFWSRNPTHTMVDATTLTLTTTFAAYLYVRYPAERLLWFMTFAAAASLLLSAMAVVFFPGIGIDAYQQDAWRGIFWQRNNCATICVFYFILGLHYRARVPLEYMLRGIVLILSLVFIVMSGSRTGWGLTLVALAISYWLRFARRLNSLHRIVLSMAALISSLVAVTALAVHFKEVLALVGKDPTLTQRTVIWAEALMSVAKHPLVGYGYSAFWSGLSGESMHSVLVTGWMEAQAQNGYLDVLLQLGLLGLVPLVWMIARGLVQSQRALQERRFTPTVCTATVFITVMLVENITESSFLVSQGVLWLYTLLALFILSGQKKEMGVI
jgi:exopolysaccharide production protein ExoQ